MDINIDQGQPQGNLERTESGKYLYKQEDGKSGLDKFNRQFEQYKTQRKDIMGAEIQKKIDLLNTPPQDIPAYDLSIGQIMINIKDSMFNITDDILRFDVTSNTFLKENRLFYTGLFFVIMACLLYLYLYFIDSESSNKGSTVINIQN
ncbi:hypothetical protein Klosneuvirus_2_205 [Klosneuvirus KNV1]|uniref:Uncharacterized protein n=1 Tax=Klosneuvirus KNV1 TaxID=1977640 RepID=A0A1V0SJ72_9VIRU|nr:hypothetical protein Klosneuvirus_2_205 [Klosneuvirus KNV1]